MSLASEHGCCEILEDASRAKPSISLIMTFILSLGSTQAHIHILKSSLTDISRTSLRSPDLLTLIDSTNPPFSALSDNLSIYCDEPTSCDVSVRPQRNSLKG